MIQAERAPQTKVAQILPESGYVGLPELASELKVTEPRLLSQLYVMEARGDVKMKELVKGSGQFVVTRGDSLVMYPAQPRPLPPVDGPTADLEGPGPTPGPSSSSDLRLGP